MNKFLFAIILAAVVSLHTLAAVTVTSQLSADETSVGMPVQMQVRVEGTTNVVLPDDLNIDGLQTHLTGRQVQTQIDFGSGRMVASGVYYYTIIPLREGHFEIPPFEVNADGHKHTTTLQKLVVQAGTAPAPRPAPAMPLPPGGGSNQQQQQPEDPDSKLAYAEIVVPKKTIYAGEVVPVEMRFYFSERVGFRMANDEPPQVSGEGFTVSKPAPPNQTEETVDGTNYRVLTFKTSITAVKSGEMQLPTMALHGILRIPTKGPAGMQDIFGQFFGGQGGFTDDREVSITTDPQSIRVKALPAAGRPANFSGAVGDFTISATADPAKVAPGDPITLKVAVTGRGNFDAMGEPTLVDSDGWRVYPPTSRFEKSDSIGYAGTKTFETPMVAQQPQTHTPIMEFSYFDPDKAKYFTIRTQPVAIEAAASASAPTPSDAAAATPQAAATPAQQNQDGAWLTHPTPRSWQPIARRPGFWIFNGIAALALIAILIALGVRRSRQGPAGQRAAVIRERDRIAAELGRANLADDAFYEKALEVLNLQAGLEGDGGAFELVRKLESRGRDMSDLQTVLARADEMKFSGAGSLVTRLDAEERRKIVRALLEACR